MILDIHGWPHFTRLFQARLYHRAIKAGRNTVHDSVMKCVYLARKNIARKMVYENVVGRELLVHRAILALSLCGDVVPLNLTQPNSI